MFLARFWSIRDRFSAAEPTAGNYSWFWAYRPIPFFSLGTKTAFGKVPLLFRAFGTGCLGVLQRSLNTSFTGTNCYFILALFMALSDLEQKADDPCLHRGPHVGWLRGHLEGEVVHSLLVVIQHLNSSIFSWIFLISPAGPRWRMPRSPTWCTSYPVSRGSSRCCIA
jgi:hypothetical protein